MKNSNSFPWVHAVSGILLCAISFAFTRPMGAHSVQVYLDDKVVVDQYLDFKKQGSKVAIGAADRYEKLIVKYSECGRTVTGRKLTVKSEDNKVLKDWRFEGASTGFDQPMECRVKDILALKQKGSNTLKLYYSSNDFPEGQHVASLVIDGNATTASN